jgi:hypothetical protein
VTRAEGTGRAGDALGIVERALDVLQRQSCAAPAGAARGAPAPALASAPDPISVASSITDRALEDLRRQALDLVDRILALVAERQAPVSGGPGALPGALPILAPAGGARPGDVIRLPLRLANDAPAEAPLSFMATDLLGESGHRIPASSVSFWPENPVLRPSGQAAVEVKIALPVQTPAGRYGGLVQVVGQPDARTLVSIKVE